MNIQIVINDFIGDYFTSQFRDKEKEVFKIFEFYAVEAIRYFLIQQNGGVFWTNRTYKALRSFIAYAFIRKNEIVLRFAYDGTARDKYTNKEYTQYLETMQEGKFAALPSIIDEIAPMLIKDIKRLYGDES